MTPAVRTRCGNYMDCYDTMALVSWSRFGPWQGNVLLHGLEAPYSESKGYYMCCWLMERPRGHTDGALALGAYLRHGA